MSRAKRGLCLLLAVLVTVLLPVPGVSLEYIPFKDVRPEHWHYEAVCYVREQGLFSGTDKGTFQPDEPMTRGMFVQVLSNLAGADLAGYSVQHFADVRPGQWYMGAVEWAALYGITAGNGKFTFGPNEYISREQIAALLYRYAGASGNDTSLGGLTAEFTDYNKVSGYAKEAVDWAVSRGLLQGTDKGELLPRDHATRAQAAQIFYNARELFPNKEIIAGPVELPVPTKLELKLYAMSLEEKTGQLFLPQYPGAGSVKSMTGKYSPAGYVFFARDFSGKDKSQVQNMTAGCQDASKTPLFIAADEEGGTVVRVSSNHKLAPAPFEAPGSIYSEKGIEGLLEDTRTKSKLLLSLGINLNLAPVCDVSTDPGDFIYPRSLRIPAGESAEVIGAMVEAMEEEGISGSLKHFPGYGNNKDTHTGISLDKRPYEQFQSEDFLPFKAGIDAGAPAVLVSHNIIACMDNKKPASLSAEVHRVLREELAFEGVVMTDDLSMDAVKLYTGGKSPAVEAFRAGNDLLLTKDWERDYRALLEAVKRGEISLKDVEASAMRILKWKEEKGLL